MSDKDLHHLPPKTRHTATYSSDKRKGGYLVRVQGPDAELLAGREVPVSMRGGTFHRETLDRLIWTGLDTETGLPVALYTFIAKPREAAEVLF